MADFKDIRTLFEIAMNEAEATMPVSIGKEIAGYINSNDLDTISDIKRLAGSSNYRLAIISHFESLGLSNDDATAVFNIITKGSDMQKVSEYLMSNKKDIQQFLDKKVNVYEWLASIGITDKKTSAILYDYATNTKPVTGPGEVFLSLFIDGGTRPTSKEKGDVRINGLEVEVKANGGRLIGQKGYGDAKSMRIAIKKSLEDLVSHFGADIQVEDSSNDSAFHMTKKEPREIGRVLSEISKQKGKFSKKDLLFISEKLLDAYQSYLLNSAKLMKKYIGPIAQVIKANGTIDLDKFHKQMMNLYFEYYYSLEQFDLISLVNKKTGDLLITNPTKFSKYINSGEIGYTNPSFSDSAGVQGGTYSITLK